MSRVSSVWPWIVTAAAIAAVVCLVGWPRPTLYAAGLITGAAALLAGLRLLAAEQRQTDRPPCAGCAGCGGPDCAERPDGSGPDPETARTDPDAPGQQSAEQPGHDPDDLRNRIATAIRTALKERTIPPLTLYGHQASPGIGLSEYDLADVALAVVQPKFDRLADQSGTCDASEVIDIGFFGRPHAFGPCILRHGHSGPVHKAANGAQWWPTNQPDVALTPPADQPDGSTT